MRNGIPGFCRQPSPRHSAGRRTGSEETMKRLSLLLLFLFVFGAAAPDAGPGENAAHL